MENPIDWSETINSDVIDEMDAETLEKVLAILDKIEQRGVRNGLERKNRNVI